MPRPAAARFGIGEARYALPGPGKCCRGLPVNDRRCSLCRARQSRQPPVPNRVHSLCSRAVICLLLVHAGCLPVTRAARVETPSSTFDSEKVDFRVSSGVSAALPCLAHHKPGDAFIASTSWDGGTPVEQNRSASSAHLSHGCKPPCPSSPNPESEAVNGLPSAPASCWPAELLQSPVVVSRGPGDLPISLRDCRLAAMEMQSRICCVPLPVSSFFLS